MIQTYESESDVELAPATSSSPDTLSCPPSLENCDSVIVAFESRRFVIHRFNEKKDHTHQRIRSVDQLCKCVRAMKSGEEVYYKGRIERLIAIAPY